MLLKAKIVAKSLLRTRVSLTEANRTIYDSPHIVGAYASMINLKRPEQTILNLLKKDAPFQRMLDIGVGAGRTTGYFSKIVEEYIGIDYSENMIRYCRKKFQNWPKVSFKVADARNLSRYKDSLFDFVLFSHGGLDAVEHKDRLRILRGIQRVAKEGGVFCFSTSNLDAMLQYCQIRLSKHLKVFAKRTARVLLIRLLNSEMWKHVRGKRKKLGHTTFNVGAGNWGLRTYCITPQAQINQLEDLGFKDIRIYDLNGKATHATNATDIELYFICKVNKHQEAIAQ